MRRLGVCLLVIGALAVPATAHATEAGDLAAAKGITLALAEQDLRAQRQHPAIVEAVRAKLGAAYAGVKFNLKTAHFVVPLLEGCACKAAAQEAVGSAPTSYPTTKTAYAQVQAKEQTAAMARRPTYSTLGCTFPWCSPLRGGVKIESQPWYSPQGQMLWRYCSTAFITSAGDLLTAGHCPEPVNGNSTPASWWGGEPTITCGFPYNEKDNCTAGPPPACKLWPVKVVFGEAGDYALMHPEGCEGQMVVQTWDEPGEALSVRSFAFASCIAGRDCIHHATMKAYPGLWECHYSANYEHGACGEVKQVDVSVTYGSGETVRHVDHVCMSAFGGDSGGATVMRGEGSDFGTPEAEATGILSGSGATFDCGKEGFLGPSSIVQEIGPALEGLGAKL